MDYPEGFPRHLQAKVDAAIHAAELERLKLKAQPELWQGAIILWIKMIFFPFGDQVCEAGREGIWTGATMRKELDAFLRKLASLAYKEYAPINALNADPHFATLSIRKIVETVKQLPEWEELQRKLQAVAESRARSQTQRADELEAAEPAFAKPTETDEPTPERNAKAPARPEGIDRANESRRRNDIVMPILVGKGWTRSRWGAEAMVGKTCPYEYLKGRRLREGNRKALAEAIGLTAEQLPND